MKIIYVKSCHDCPLKHKDHEFDEWWVCPYWKFRFIPALIPDFCKLEDADGRG